MGRRHVWAAVSTLIGTIIGAGILGIPYVAAQAGFLTALVTIIGLGIAMLVVHLYLGEVVLRTKGNHQLTGYADKYLGKVGKALMTVSMVVGIYGALVAYLIGEGQSFAEIFGGSPLYWMLAFFAVMGIIIYRGIKAVEVSELLIDLVKLFVFLAVVLVIGFSGLFSPSRLVEFDLSKLLIPYGVVLFAFLGTAAIPEMREILRGGHWKQMKKAIIIASVIPIVAYLIFAFVVVGVAGTETTEVATVGLGRLLGTVPLILLNLFAILAMATSFIALGLAIKEMFVFDYKLHKDLAWALTMFIPLALVLMGVQSFIAVIGIAGAMAGGLAGVLIVLMHARAQAKGERKPEFRINKNYVVMLVLLALFVAGAITQLVGLIT